MPSGRRQSVSFRGAELMPGMERYVHKDMPLIRTRDSVLSLQNVIDASWYHFFLNLKNSVVFGVILDIFRKWIFSTYELYSR